MTTESLEDRLIVALHEKSSHQEQGPARFCEVCREAIDSIMPVISDWIWNGADDHDLD